MRPRKLKLVATLGGFPMSLGTIKVQSFAKLLEADTELVCSFCGEKPKWTGGYVCICGHTYNHWSKLVRRTTVTHEIVEQPRLNDKGEIPQATVYVLNRQEFASKYSDATMNEYGMTTDDATAAQNISKLLTAVEMLGANC